MSNMIVTYGSVLMASFDRNFCLFNCVFVLKRLYTSATKKSDAQSGSSSDDSGQYEL